VELLAPLIKRGLAILSRRGEIDKLRPDGRMVSICYLSPLSRFHKDREMASTLQRVEWLRRLVPDMPIFNSKDARLWLASTLDLPEELLHPAPALAEVQQEAADI
jgi:hypothetical protein